MTEVIKKSSYDVAKMQYKNTDEKELREIIDSESRIVIGIPGNNATEVAEMAKHLGVVEACQDIIKERKETDSLSKEFITNLFEKWEKNLDERRQKAVLNLKTAVTPNAQLVAAILEDEDGKTMDELHFWCDELTTIDDAEFTTLLSNLVNENIITLIDDKYYIRRIVTESLFPEPENDDFKNSILRDGKLRGYYMSVNLGSKAEKILVGYALMSSHKPQTADDVFSIILDFKESGLHSELFEYCNIKDAKSIKYDLVGLCNDSDFFKRYRFSGQELREKNKYNIPDYYCVKMLGEKEDN